MLQTIILCVLGVLTLATLIILIVKSTKKTTGNQNFDLLLSESKKQNEYLEKTIKNLFENQFAANKQFNEFIISTIKNYNDNVATYLSNLSKAQIQQLTNIENRLNDILKQNDAKLNRVSDVIIVAYL